MLGRCDVLSVFIVCFIILDLSAAQFFLLIVLLYTSGTFDIILVFYLILFGGWVGGGPIAGRFL